MHPSVELSMIVKNGAAGLHRAIKSVRPLVERIVIGDTGSTDGSAAAAEALGAMVLHVPWTGDYAAARNQVLARAECDWVLVLDPDEELDPSALRLIPELLGSGDADAFQSWIWNYVLSLDYRAGGEAARANPGGFERAANYPAYFRSLNTRLFRREPDIYFEHVVHETVLDRLVALGRRRAHAPFVIHHFGYVEDAPAERDRKTAFYRALSARKAAAEPENGWAQLEMGMHELDCAKDYAAAQPFLAKACALVPQAATAWLYAGMCSLRLGRPDEALQLLERSLAIAPVNPLLHASLGDASFALGRYGDARLHFLEAQKLGDASPLSLAKLGSAEARLGAFAAGMEKMREAANAMPESVEILDMLAIAALLSGHAEEARCTAARRLRLGELNAFGSLVAASVFLHTGAAPEAAAVLSGALVRFPADRQIAELAEHPAVRGFLEPAAVP